MSKFAEQLAQAVNMDLTPVTIPGFPLEAYFTPMTLADSQKIRARSGDSNEEFIVYTLIYKLVDKQGKKLLDIGDKTTLLSKVPFDVLTNIVQQINAANPVDVEDIEGN